MGEIYARYNGLKGCFKNTNSLQAFKAEVCRKFNLMEIILQYFEIDGGLATVITQDQFIKVRDMIRKKNSYFVIQNPQDSVIAERLSDIQLVKSEIVDSQIEKFDVSQIIESVSIKPSSYLKIQPKEEKPKHLMNSSIFPRSPIDRSKPEIKFVDVISSKKMPAEESKTVFNSGSMIKSSSTESAFFIQQVEEFCDIPGLEEEQEEIIERIGSNPSFSSSVHSNKSTKLQHSPNSESSLKVSSEINKPAADSGQLPGLPAVLKHNKFYQRPENSHIDSEYYKYGHRKCVSSRVLPRPALSKSETQSLSWVPQNRRPCLLPFSESLSNGLCHTCGSPELNFYTCLSCSTSLYCKRCFASQRHPHAPSTYPNPCPQITALYSKIQSLGFSSLSSISEAISLCDFDYNKSVSHLLSSP